MSDDGKTFLGVWWERVKIHVVGVLILFTSSTLGLIFTPIGDRVLQIWNTPETLVTIETKVDHLLTEVKKATGENRVIYEEPGLSFVTEPVYYGDTIHLNMIVNRTQTGASCVLLKITPLFTDERNVAFSGPDEPVARQIGTQPDRVSLELEVPKQVRTGRVTVFLSLEFECGKQKVFETTRPVPFMLLERS